MERTETIQNTFDEVGTSAQKRASLILMGDAFPLVYSERELRIIEELTACRGYVKP
jgi:hypothetical protein